MMEIIDFLNSLDTRLLLAINSMHNAYFDSFMWAVSAKITWVPTYLMLIVLLLRRNVKQAVFLILLAALAVAIADQVSSTIIKHSVERFRPTHNPAIANMIHVVNDYRGGRFGFVSSHAANPSAFVVLFSLVFRNRMFFVTSSAWALLMMYSRMYLGVHYPGDIIGGIIVGALSGLLCYYAIYRLVQKHENSRVAKIFEEKKWETPAAPARDVRWLSIAMVGYVIVVAVFSAFML